MPRKPKTPLLLSLCATLALALFPAAAPAAEGAAAEGATVPSTTTPASTPTEPSSSSSTEAPTSTTPTSPAPAPTSPASGTGTTTTTTEIPTAGEPKVQAQAPQVQSGPARGRSHAKAHTAPAAPAGGTGEEAKATHVHAPSPSALTPPPPSALGASLSGVSPFFIANFSIPPFLLPIYQAAGSAYGIPWQVLAAINEVETDYGRDLSLSSAGAEGWMQFIPSSWARYGVDANGDGYADPYNPADAIFAAARYLRAAGGARHIRSAIFAYNHSQSYVESVMLRAQLLRGTPPQLLQAVTSLAEARFPVHAPSHFADGFPAVPSSAGQASDRAATKTLVATVIYSRPSAPVIAVQDGVIAAIGRSAQLGRYVVLRDDFGDTYTYGHLGSVATFYPVLTPRRRTPPRTRSTRAPRAAAARQGVSASVPIPAASAGVQPRSPLSAAAVSSGLALGAAAALETAPAPMPPLLPARPPARSLRPSPVVPRVFTAGHEEVHLQPLRVGAHVIAGTVIGHLGAPTAELPAVTVPASTIEPGGSESAAPGSTPAGAAGDAPAGRDPSSAAGDPSPAAGSSIATGPQAEMIFQIRPSGVGAPMIDPKPILDSWVRLESSLAFRATGKHRFPAAPGSPATSLSSEGAGSIGAGAGGLSSTTNGFDAKPPRPGSASAAGALDSSLTPGQWLQLIARLGAIPDPLITGGHSTAAIPDRPGAVSATSGASTAPAAEQEEGSGVYN
jgi:hypothetical protein